MGGSSIRKVFGGVWLCKVGFSPRSTFLISQVSLCAMDIKGKTALDRANAEGRGEVSRSLKKAIDDKKVAEDPAEQQQLVSLLTRFASLRESRST